MLEIRRELGGSWVSPAVQVAVNQTMPAAEELVFRNEGPDSQPSTLRHSYDELRRALFDAAQAQRRLCGRRHLHRGDFDIASEIFPVRYLSGDFVCAFDQGTDSVLAIGDIAGKGLDAGMWFTHVMSLIRRRAAESGPAEAVSAINRDFCRTALPVPMTTLFLARLDVVTGALRYCNAGHPPSLLLRAGGGTDTLHEGGPVLGTLKDAEFSGGEVVLQPGDVVLGYSDGISECSNVMGEEFGVERLQRALEVSGGSSANGRLFSVLGAVKDFAGAHQREDDIALLVVEREGRYGA